MVSWGHAHTHACVQVAHSIASVMAYGGMRYIATGRGFSIQTTDFVKMFSMYARTHLYMGFVVLFFVVCMYIVGVSGLHGLNLLCGQAHSPALAVPAHGSAVRLHIGA